jgi:hypothetical protein
MLRVGFEPTIPVFERGKTVHGLDLAATVISCFLIQLSVINNTSIFLFILFQFSHLTQWVVTESQQAGAILDIQSEYRGMFCNWKSSHRRAKKCHLIP